MATSMTPSYQRSDSTRRLRACASSIANLETYPITKSLPESATRCSFDDSPAPPPLRLHGMLRETVTSIVGNAYPFAFASRHVNLVDYRLPDEPIGGVSWLARVRPARPGQRGLLSAGVRYCQRPNRITVGVPWPGMYAPDVSITWVRSSRGKNSSISFLPNSRFMNELAVIWPVYPAPTPHVNRGSASLKIRSANGTDSEYFPVAARVSCAIRRRSLACPSR